MKRIISLILCFAMMLAFASCAKEGEDTAVDENPAGDEIVMSTTNYSVNYSEFIFAYCSQVNSLINNYANYFGDDYKEQLKSYLGLDLDVSFKDQTIPDGTQTFYDYFLSSAKSKSEDILIFCEKAKADGITLTEDDLAEITANVESYASAAEEAGVSIAAYFGDTTETLTIDDVKSYSEKNLLAGLAYDKMTESYDISDESVDKEFNANISSYGFVDYLAYTMQIDDANVTQEVLDTSVAELSAVKSEAEFTEWVENFYNNVLYKDNPDKPEYYDDVLFFDNVSYGEDCDYLVWMFGDEATEGATYVSKAEDGNSATVYFLKNGPHENEYYKQNVRHILFQTSSYDTDEACKAKADEVYALYEANPTEENFAALATEYSEDTGSTENGGLYEDVDLNQMVAEFEDWCFDESRVAGDTGIIKSSYGYHIMYYVGEGEHIAQGHDSAREALEANEYQKQHTQLQALYAVTADDDLIAKIPG